ncbi:hypothetical protein [uncultured Sphingomonas sp.]|uniref:hypothetical protein n=2 Tax=uncultured Sphingomonas sp. TaxID=158754 RepID=UPI0025CE08F2|nr:hypothetical protein [uncultured Sphingomonas sp.]
MMARAVSDDRGLSLPEALAEELVLASKVLADLAYDLGADEATLRRHMTSLQKIDQLTQAQLAIAGVLRRLDDPQAALGDITLESMARRIQRGMVEGVYPATATYDIAN